jgi:tRNA 2-thiouridine synthesizing protein A
VSEHVVDARRLLCPMPVIRTQNAVDGLPLGTRVTVLCTDPGALNDIPAWCRVHGHSIISTATVDGQITIVVEVGER